MADVVCAKTVRDIAVRCRIVRYGRCGVCKNQLTAQNVTTAQQLSATEILKIRNALRAPAKATDSQECPIPKINYDKLK